jgi:aryl-alcohol dehydrogenase-like predicted oxidoreductase
MVFIHYKNSPINVSRLAIGTASFGSKMSKKQAFKTLDVLSENGVNYLDTASSYGLGMSEKIIGDYVKNHRNQWFLSTKVGIKATEMPMYKRLLIPIVRKIYHIPFLNARIKKQSSATYDKSILSLTEIDASVRQSFKNLRTDYLNQLLLHNNFDTYLSDPSVSDYLNGLKTKFLVHQIGITTDVVDADILKKLDTHIAKIDTLQIPFKDRAMVNYADKYINYFSIFNANPNAQKSLAEFQKNKAATWKGHLIVAMSSKAHIEQNSKNLSF